MHSLTRHLLSGCDIVEELTLCMTGYVRLAGRHFRPEVRDTWAKWQIDNKPWLNDNRREVAKQSKNLGSLRF